MYKPAASLLIPLLTTLLLAAGCTHPPQVGQDAAAVAQRWGQPTSRYALPDGQTRLEYAFGPFGRETWMLDVDAAGRILRVDQVLSEAAFADFQARSPGMTRNELLLTLGRPAETRGLARGQGEYWSWRYHTNDCLWFQVTLGADGLVRDSGYGPDPMCERPRGDLR